MRQCATCIRMHIYWAANMPPVRLEPEDLTDAAQAVTQHPKYIIDVDEADIPVVPRKMGNA